jgi:hypothetical protein
VKGEEYRPVRVRIMECEGDGCSLREAGRIRAEEGMAGQGRAIQDEFFVLEHITLRRTLSIRKRSSILNFVHWNRLLFTSLYLSSLHSTPLHCTAPPFISVPFHSCYFNSFYVTFLPCTPLILFPSLPFLIHEQSISTTPVSPIRGLKLLGMEEKLFVTVSLSISKVEANKPLSAPRRQNSLRHRQICRDERRGEERGIGEGGTRKRTDGGKSERESEREKDTSDCA